MIDKKQPSIKNIINLKAYIMNSLDLQSAIGDTLLQVVLQQRAQAKKARELREQSTLQASISSRVYAKAA